MFFFFNRVQLGDRYQLACKAAWKWDQVPYQNQFVIRTAKFLQTDVTSHNYFCNLFARVTTSKLLITLQNFCEICSHLSFLTLSRFLGEKLLTSYVHQLNVKLVSTQCKAFLNWAWLLFSSVANVSICWTNTSNNSHCFSI
jgi:hypothetical protein